MIVIDEEEGGSSSAQLPWTVEGSWSESDVDGIAMPNFIFRPVHPRLQWPCQPWASIHSQFPIPFW